MDTGAQKGTHKGRTPLEAAWEPTAPPLPHPPMTASTGASSKCLLSAQ